MTFFVKWMIWIRHLVLTNLMVFVYTNLTVYLTLLQHIQVSQLHLEFNTFTFIQTLIIWHALTHTVQEHTNRSLQIFTL